MPILQIRDLPDPIYQKLAQQARKEHRSLSQQAIVELAKAMNINLSAKNRRHRVIESIHEIHRHTSVKTEKDPLDWIREDRGR